jgi:D-alanine-D-alanine ligase
VLHNRDGGLAAGEALDALAVAGVEAAVRGIVAAISSWVDEVEVLVVPNDPREVLRFVDGLDCDLIVNQVESLGGDARREAHFAAALELRGVPYTGSGPRALALCLDKPLARAVLAEAGVPIARGVVLHSAQDQLPELNYPLLLKPSREDASHGITLDSLARDEAGLRERARSLIERYRQPALVEEYIPGHEINVALLEGATPDAPARILELSEIEFSNFPPEAPRIVTYAGKWVEGSPEWNGTRSVAARLQPELAERVCDAAAKAWRALGLCGYARVDLRAETGGAARLAVIDVNPNPDISPDAGFSLTAERSNLSHAQLIEHILQCGLRRHAARP